MCQRDPKLSPNNCTSLEDTVNQIRDTGTTRNSHSAHMYIKWQIGILRFSFFRKLAGMGGSLNICGPHTLSSLSVLGLVAKWDHSLKITRNPNRWH